MKIACIQADADRFHVNCAKKVYGEKTIQTAKTLWAELYRYDLATFIVVCPKDREGNPINIIEREEWDHMKQESKAHGKRIYESCGYCLGRIK